MTMRDEVSAIVSATRSHADSVIMIFLTVG
jgi:hypothetical protein